MSLGEYMLAEIKEFLEQNWASHFTLAQPFIGTPFAFCMLEFSFGTVFITVQSQLCFLSYQANFT